MMSRFSWVLVAVACTQTLVRISYRPGPGNFEAASESLVVREKHPGDVGHYRVWRRVKHDDCGGSDLYRVRVGFVNQLICTSCGHVFHARILK